MGKILEFPHDRVRNCDENAFSLGSEDGVTANRVIHLEEDPIQQLRKCTGIDQRPERGRLMDLLKNAPEYTDRLVNALNGITEDAEFRASIVNILMTHEGERVRKALFRIVINRDEDLWVRSTAYRALQKYAGYRELLQRVVADENDALENLCGLESGS